MDKVRRLNSPELSAIATFVIGIKNQLDNVFPRFGRCGSHGWNIHGHRHTANERVENLSRGNAGTQLLPP